MLFHIGRGEQRGDVVDLLLACHRRVLEHLVLGRRIANAPPTTTPESIRDAATRVRRYFADAFPLHRLDEEEDIFPRLLGHNDELDAAIGELMRDHVAHDASVNSIVEVCGALAADPTQHRALSTKLRDAVRALEAELVSHLTLEERTVFPALALLRTEDRQAILDAMRSRRDVALAS